MVMLWKSTTKKPGKTAFVAALVCSAVLPYWQSAALLHKAHFGERERDFTRVVRTMTGGGSIQIGLISSAKHQIKNNALDTAALDKLILAKAASGNDVTSNPLIKVTGKLSRRSLSFLAAELLASARYQETERFVIAFDRLSSLAPGLRPGLFAVAVPILDDPLAAKLLAHRQSRPWFIDFLSTAVKQPQRLDQVAVFLTTTRPINHVTKDALVKIILTKYAETNQIAKAQAFAETLDDESASNFNNLNFQGSKKINAYDLFDWQFPNPDAQPILNSDGSLKFFISQAPSSKPLAQKLFFFSPGQHRVQTSVIINDDAKDAFVYWKISCGRFAIPQSTQIKGKPRVKAKAIELTFIAPAKCQGYRLSLHLIPPQDHSDQLIIDVTSPKKVVE